MKAPGRTNRWIGVFRNQPLTVRLLAAAAALLTAASALAAPVRADNPDDNFIDALNHAGIDFGEPGNAMSVGQSICPMLSQPGGNFAAAASSVSGRGMSPAMARMFTTIAIQTYCPEQMANLASGNLSVPQMPGMPGMGGQLPGMAGQLPGMAGQVPGLPRQIPAVPGI
ncbi:MULTISPECIES: DUF732 domain-containing protein [unclassified Mycobacterium]|uniref:DUF732 domain-containing protein n=1 Tax=unclassified Mycobacterium TaxID=2642494 RepID=UPI0008022F25|nr:MULTISPECIES: DUF732 domain-containing protein [unclassified Mycobacterium]OBG67692.1 hypothetical protein A5704_09120 [Mycobacterium sp. E735]OBG79060.1 hypothetical protein A9X05_02590 [Mycobacterium sp. E3298]OBH30099.1 hypothetical protein A9X03_08790 [Mycobacterium sp. E1715]